MWEIQTFNFWNMKKLITIFCLALVSCGHESKYKVGEHYLTNTGEKIITDVNKKEKQICYVSVTFDDSDLSDVILETEWMWDNMSKQKVSYDSLFLQKHPIYNFDKIK